MEEKPSSAFVIRAPSYEKAYRKLHNAFMDRLRNSITAIDNIMAQQRLAPIKRDWLERTMHLAHGLAGSGTTFGFPAISASGQKADVFLDRIMKSTTAEHIIGRAEFETLENLMNDLKQVCIAALEDEEKNLPEDLHETTGENNMKPEYCALLVDDDDHLREILALKLRQRNIRVISASNGDSAMALIAQDKPDLVILDIMMPGMTGHDVLRRMKQDAEFVSIPVIMLTGSVQEKDVFSSLRSGAIDYVIKPVDPDQLVKRIEKILDASRYNVVIADNDPLIQQLLDSKFRISGFKVRIVDDGTKAWDIIFKTLPDLVILDRMMPGMEGLTILKNMREETATRNIPVIILSARKQERDIEEGLKHGAQDYIAKPFIPDDLIARSMNLLNASKSNPS